METFEPPKYIEKLIAAINDGAKSAQLGALAFTAIGVFLLATAFSATDEDLLLNRALTISQLGGTAVPVVFAFGLAPAVFVAAHFYTLIRYDMLTGNLRRFREDLAEMPEADRDRCRQLLANVEFVNAQVMPVGSRASSRMFDWTVRVLLAVFPVAVLLFVQLQSLRLQSEWVTWTHHACIVLDVVLLVWFFGRLRGDNNWHFRRAPMQRKVALCWMPAIVLAVDLVWLQVPGPTSKTVGKNLAVYLEQYSGDLPGAGAPLMRQVEWLVALHPVDLLLCTPGAWGCRFLTVRHRIIVAKVWDATTFVALRAGADADAKHRASFEAASLPGRTLRFADLAGSELFAADLTVAQLQGAKLPQAQLRGAYLAFAQLQGADLGRAQLQGAYLFSAQLQSAFLLDAQLQGAYLGWAQLQGATLQRAQLQSAFLLHAYLQGANLQQAQLQGANLGEARFQGAHLSEAHLQGANLQQAGLQGANLSGAQLQGANLQQAGLQGANLSGAQLQGANLEHAQLQGANLSGAQLQGANLQQAGLWISFVNEHTRLGLADLRGANFDPMSAEDVLAQLPFPMSEAVTQLLRKRLAPPADPPPHDTAGRHQPGTGWDAANTADSKILVTDRDDTAWSDLNRTTEPADIDPALAELLADTVAPTAPQAAEAVARRVISPGDEDKQRLLIKLLGCRLQAQVDAKRLTLSTETIERLRKASGPCDQPSP